MKKEREREKVSASREKRKNYSDSLKSRTQVHHKNHSSKEVSSLAIALRTESSQLVNRREREYVQ